MKSPLRHVRTRLYFTSESHVHGIVNTLKYWTAAPDGVATASPPRESGGSGSSRSDESPGGPLGSHGLAASARTSGSSLGGGASAFASVPQQQSAPQMRLVSPDGLRMLDATPELDYLTTIVFRLCVGEG